MSRVGNITLYCKALAPNLIPKPSQIQFKTQIGPKGTEADTKIMGRTFLFAFTHGMVKIFSSQMCGFCVDKSFWGVCKCTENSNERMWKLGTNIKERNEERYFIVMMRY